MPLARLVLCVCLAVLAGCTAPTVTVQPGPVAFGGRSWIVRNPDALAAAILPLPALLPDAPAPPPDPAVLATWRDPVAPWLAVARRGIAAAWLDPPHAARALMLLAVGVNDTLTAAEAARARGLELSDHAAVAEVASRVLAQTHPQAGAPSPADLEIATWVGVWRGEATAAGVLNGRNLGAAVAAEILAWAAADGSAEGAPPFVVPSPVPGVWAPSAPDFAPAQEPAWGRVRTVVIGNPANLRTPAPPVWGSSEMEAQIQEFTAVQAALTDEQRLVAAHWAAGAGTETPPGMWFAIAETLVAEHELSPAEAAGVYAVLGIALHDTAVASWAAKYHFMLARPVQVVGERTREWAPLLTTPPHPSYPSGHACFSGAASAILAEAFPQAAGELRRQAEEAARSRVYAGIHWPVDGTAGLAQGASVAEKVLEQLNEQ